MATTHENSAMDLLAKSINPPPVQKMNKDMKAIELAKAALEKEFGKNAIIFGDAELPEVEVIPTGNFELDLALGVGGLPRGRITEVYGAEGLGKTLIALTTAANCQKEGGLVAYVDVECDLNPEWAETLGVNINDMIIAQPSSGEEALTIAETLLKTKQIDLLVFDSVAAMTPLAEIAGEMDDVQVGAQARMMAKGLRKLRHPILESGSVVIFINQIRDKIGFMQSGTISPGGRALKFASSVRIELKKAQQDSAMTNSAGESVGTTVKAQILKNKVGNPMKVVEYNNLHGIGFDNYGSIIKLGKRYGLIQLSGSWYSYGDHKLGQGITNAGQFIKDNPDLENEITEAIKHSYKEAKKK